MLDFIIVFRKYTDSTQSVPAAFPSGRYTTYKAHKNVESVTIHYFLHPLYEQTVTVLDKRDFVTEKFYIIAFFENQVYLPAWMTDPGYCQRCQIAETPCCCFKALQELSSLLQIIQF